MKKEKVKLKSLSKYAKKDFNTISSMDHYGSNICDYMRRVVAIQKELVDPLKI